MLHAMSCPKTSERAKMVHIHFSRQTFSHLIEVHTLRMKEVQPEPNVRRQLRVVPGIPYNVISPGMSIDVVSMHNVTMVSDAIPSSLLILVSVEVEDEVQCVFQFSAQPRLDIASLAFSMSLRLSCD